MPVPQSPEDFAHSIRLSTMGAPPLFTTCPRKTTELSVMDVGSNVATVGTTIPPVPTPEIALVLMPPVLSELTVSSPP